MSLTPPLRIGFIGAGANTRARHLPGFKVIPGVELKFVCNRSAESSQKVAKEFGISRIEQNWREAVKAPDVDAICIGTWPYLHAEISIAALKAGKHVLTEARMARNAVEAKQMAFAAKAASKLVAQVVPAPMSLDLDSTAIEAIANGWIGKLREVCVTHTNGGYADSKTAFGWRQDFNLSGYNTLTVGIYYEIVRRWLGMDPKRVFALGTVFTRERRDADGSSKSIRIPESMTILGRYVDDGRFIGHFSGVEAGTGRNEIRINGSAGCLRADLAKGKLWYTPVGGTEDVMVIPASARRGWRVEQDFVDSIRTGAPVKLTSFEDGLNYMRFTEAVFRSQESGGMWVDV
ncbi:MAG TPA: Gfo/Idh/MocA family oxidoreductase [Gammaproteobacteria bacterium]|nr:Gfo/Idh/MocA family oxidoreductase [Gammaproteobacteria bacterium]